MTISEIQQKIADALNRVEELVQGGCTAFAEDSHSVVFDVDKALKDGGVAIVVVTPDIQRAGSGEAEGLPVEMQIEVQCSERPALNRESEGHLTALEAAELVAHVLDGDQLEFASIRQFADAQTRTVTASAAFGLTTILTQEERN